jgi:hypothetical protein
MLERRPLLITGGHRSGTGWVGEMFAATPSPRLAYIWEPFSLRSRPGICRARFPYWFTYVDDENGHRYRDAIADTLRFRYSVGTELRSLRSPKDVARFARDWTRTEFHRRRGSVPLVKDPIALFSAEWLADTFDMDVVVMLRHPAAFVNSLVRLGWRHPFEHFTRQPALMRQLGDWDAEIAAFATEERPLLEQGILLWNIMHERILRYRERRNDWVFVRLEDIAVEPTGRFSELYGRLGLTWTEGVRATIEEHSASIHPAETMDASSHRRDSRSAVDVWKSRLSAAEVERVRSGTERIGKELYGDVDW